MRDLMIIMATMKPTENIVDELQEELTKYKCDPTQQNRATLAASCQMFILNLITDNDPKKMMKLISELERGEAASDLLKINPS